jgi:hypothetical protein
MALERYREIRSARFPLGLPDRSDPTVLEAFAGAWLLVDHVTGESRLVGVAEDYDAARAWLTGRDAVNDAPAPGAGVSGRAGPAPRRAPARRSRRR